MDAFADTDGLNFGAPTSGSDGSSNPNESDHSNNTDTEIFFNEWIMFKTFWDRALNIYQPLEIAIIALGLFGNILALLTLMRSKRMNSSPSFAYHRVLVTADLIFCITYFAHLSVKKALSVQCHPTFYKYWFGAYFAGVLNPALNFICGYVIMYMTLVIALDRFLALLLFERYRKWNTMKVAYTVIAIACFLSIVVHCWAYFVESTVIEFRLTDQPDEFTSIVSRPCWSDPIVYHVTKREDPSPAFARALKAKSYYNGAVRVGYPICLCTLTLAVLISFAKRQKKRRESTVSDSAPIVVTAAAVHSAAPSLLMKRSTTSMSSSSRKISTLTIRSDPSPSVFGSFTFTFPGFGGAGHNSSLTGQHRMIDRMASPSLRHRQRCERALFYLMISVVLLAFLQVASTEGRRILHLIFPPDEVFKRKVLPSSVPMEERISNFRFLLYGHQATRILANICTAIDRSCVCFLYIAMNNLFRKELLCMLNSALCFVCFRFCPQRVPSSAHHRQDSSDRRSRNGGPLEQRTSTPILPPPTPSFALPSPSPSSLNFPGLMPFQNDRGRGYAQSRFLGENLTLLDNAS